MQRLFGATTYRTLQRSASYATRYKTAYPLCGFQPNSLRTSLRTTIKPLHTKHPNTMSADIVLPSLTSWAESHITAIFQATDQASFTEAFNAFIAGSPGTIELNGQKLTKEQYMQQLWKDKFLEAGAEVQFLGAVSSPEHSNVVRPILRRHTALSHLLSHRPEKLGCSCKQPLQRNSWCSVLLRPGPSPSPSTLCKFRCMTEHVTNTHTTT
jgi:hypothetical protein